MKHALALVALVVMAYSVTATAAIKPKPWQWPPAKVVAKLKASSPIAAGDSSPEIDSAVCRGLGHGTAGRYSRFTCHTTWAQGNYASTLTLRVLPLRTGKLCVVTTMSVGGQVVAVPYTSGTQGTRIVPSRACP